MADTKISALTAATTPLTGTEQVPVVQSGTSKQATVGQLVGSWKVPVDAATTAALTGTVTFSSAAGTLTWTAANVTTLDGVTLAVGSRVLVKNQGGTATNAANGIYTVTAQSGTTTATWTRATASDTTAEIAGAFVAVRGGTTNGGTVWATSFKVGDTLNTTAMGWYEVLDSSQLASTNPAALGTAAPGTGTTLARADHVHPTTNLVPTGAITTSGLTQATARLLGRTTASTGAVEEISVGTGLTLSAGTLTAASGSPPDVQTFTSSGTWTKPSGAVAVTIVCIGAGGGGGSGGKNASGSSRNGGGGGGGGGTTCRTLPASLITSPVTVTVGGGGSGGTAQATAATAGNPGANGTDSTFGSLIRGGGGGGGGAGTLGTTAVTPGAAGTGLIGDATGGIGAWSTNVATSGSVSGDTTGGGGGGGVNGLNALVAAAAANAPTASQLTAGTVGTAPATSTSAGGAGGAGGSQTANTPFGGGGGGGGASGGVTSGVGGAGGNGGLYGGGGGGGGGSTGTSNSGAGGNGANGIIQVITYF